MGNSNAISPTQANLVQVCESTEIVYDKTWSTFQLTIGSVPARLQEVCTRLSLIYFCSSLFAGWILVGMC